MPQPFPNNDPIFSHKGYSKDLNPLHRHDFRYKFNYHSIPRRHFVPDFKMKVYNFNDFNEIVHRSGFNDFDLDHQLADPMDSNHYINSRSPMFIVMMGCAVILGVFSTYFIFFKNSSLSFMGIWCLRCMGRSY